MKWFNCGARAVTNYDIDVLTDPDKVFYRYAYFDFMTFDNKNKSLVCAEVDKGQKKYFCLSAQIGGDALFRISANIWNVGFEFVIWGYG